MSKRLVGIAFLVWLECMSYAQNRGGVFLSGYVKDADSGEALINAVVYAEDNSAWASTNKDGYYSLSVKGADMIICCSYVGYQNMDFTPGTTGSIRHDFLLKKDVSVLESATVSSVSRREEIALPQMGRQLVDAELAQKLPALMGETDIVRVVQMLPGVQSPSEGSAGFSVRGGGIDQNLVLMDGAPIFCSGHFLGFLSMFNSDAVKNAELFKGDFPARYGGRMSSVLNITTKDGDLNEFSGGLSLGLITSKVHLEGPIVKSKLGFSFSARRTYLDLFLPFIRDRIPENSQMYFWDINAKLNWVIGDNDRLTLSAFSGKDLFGMSMKDLGLDEMKFRYMNNVQSLRWNHRFSDDLTTNVTLYNSRYDNITFCSYSEASFDYTQQIRELGLKASASWHFGTDNTMNFGIDAAYNFLSPGTTEPVGSGPSPVSRVEFPKINAFQPAVFLQDEQKIGPVTVRAGVRLSSFTTYGPTEQRYFDPVTHELTDSVHFDSGEKIKTYFGLEPRVSASWSVNDDMSFKASYSRAYQYIQQAMVSISGSPIDNWFSASPNVKPQISDQFSLGMDKLFMDSNLDLSLETFYKNNKNIMDFKDNPGIVIDDQNREGLLRFGKSYGFGAEVMLKYDFSKWSGWLSYTWSRILFDIPEVNGGKPYLSPLNHEHAVNFVLSYDITDRWNASADWVFYSGAPTTYPVGRFNFDGITGLIYSGRNEDRMPDYHRFDISATYKTKARVAGRRWSGEWNISIYNLYARHNAWSVSFNYNRVTKQPEAVKVYLFTIVPSVSYNIQF